jgi:predicted Zn-dependent protease
MAAAVGSILTSPFNQKNEGHCDLFGIDLANSAGYDACQNVNLWERMNESNQGKNVIDMFSSHPYSGDRAKCSKNHMKVNYNKNCN